MRPLVTDRLDDVEDDPGPDGEESERETRALYHDADDAVPATDDRDAVPAADGNGTDEATVGNGADETAAAIRGSDRSPRRRVLVRATSLDDRGGRPLGYAVQLTDITEKHRRHERLREKSRRLEHKNEQLERLAGIVAHDLQTPLATGRNLLDLLRMDVDTDDPDLDAELSGWTKVRIGRVERRMMRIA